MVKLDKIKINNVEQWEVKNFENIENINSVSDASSLL